MVEQISATLPEELKFQQIDTTMSPDELLVQDGWFFLKQVFVVLDQGTTSRYKLAFKQIERLREKGEDPYKVMGYKKFGGRVGVQMERFAPWYRQNLLLQAERLDGSLDFQVFLEQENSYYRLSEVCKYYEHYLPYTYSILKRGADRSPDPLNEVGIVKYDTTYLVFMPRFGEWLRRQLL